MRLHRCLWGAAVALALLGPVVLAQDDQIEEVVQAAPVSDEESLPVIADDDEKVADTDTGETPKGGTLQVEDVDKQPLEEEETFEEEEFEDMVEETVIGDAGEAQGDINEQEEVDMNGDQEFSDLEVPMAIPLLPPPEPEEQQACHEELSGTSGVFTSANFPENYPSKSNCSWNITVPEGRRVKITFHLFNVEHNANCIWDWVKVFDTNGTLIKYICGYLQQDLFLTSTNNSLSLRFFSDGVVETAGFLASWRAVDAAGEQGQEKEDTEDKEGYLLAFPQSFAASEGGEESVCLQMFSVPTNGAVKVGLFDKKNLLDGTAVSEVTFDYQGGERNVVCKALRLPAAFESSAAIVKVTGSFEDSDYEILSYKSVRAIRHEPLLLIQTDKADYRPKQRVRARFVFLDNDLKPSSSIKRVEEVWLTNPADARLAQWKNLTLRNGMAQVEYTLSEEPLLGSNWKVHVRYNSTAKEAGASFAVNENVLPKFSVTVDGPTNLVKDSAGGTFKVCAKYTHGGKVKGVANVTFTSNFRPRHWGARPTVTVIRKPVASLDRERGCVEVTLNQTEFKTLVAKANGVEMLASVTEDVTGTGQNATHSVQVKDTPFVINTEASSRQHVVGSFPYLGIIRVVDHNEQPVPGVDLEVCARLFTSLAKMRERVQNEFRVYDVYRYTEDQFVALGEAVAKMKADEVCKTLSTGPDGYLKIAVPLNVIQPNVTKLSLKVTAVNSQANETTGMKQPSEVIDVELTASNTSLAINIVTEETPPTLACGVNVITVYFEAEPESKVDLSYFVSSSGVLLASGVESVAVGSEDKTEEYVGDAQMISFAPNGEKQRQTILGKHDIRLVRPFANKEAQVTDSINVLVYTREKTEKRGLSDTKEFTPESCDLQPTINFSKASVTPGENVQITIKGAGDGSSATCGYSVVDRSVDLLPNANAVSQGKLRTLKRLLSRRKVVRDSSRGGEGCRNANLLFQAFERLGLFVMSDQLLIDTQCDNLVDATDQTSKESGGPHALPFAESDGVEEDLVFAADVQPLAAPVEQRFELAQARPLAAAAPPLRKGASGNRRRPPVQAIEDGSFEVAENQVEIRNFFPETWLFDLVDLNDEGEAFFEMNAPHTVTTWVGEVICSDSAVGIGISNKTNLVVAQDFFIDMNMPYAVKRGEIVPLNVSVFNTVEERYLPMTVGIVESSEYKVDRIRREICLAGDDNTVETFTFKARELNKVNVTVVAKITDDIEAECDATAGEAEGYTDIIQKPIVIKPEGYPVEKVQSVFQCKSGEESQPVELEKFQLPDEGDLVEDSARAWVTVSGDIMAPTLANLDRLVSMPTGCGEQNMIGMAPNVYVMDYMLGTGNRNPALEAKAKEHMTTGYNRQQKFRHPDGSYSVWGDKDEQGSLWLTAFVVRVFSQASKFVETNAENVRQSVKWMQRHQNKDGCFDPVGYTIHKELQGTDRSLAASVLGTLLELRKSPLDVRVEDESIRAALRCITRSTNDTTEELYADTVVAYALSLYEQVRPLLGKDMPNMHEESQDRLNKLIESAHGAEDGLGQLYWKDGVSKDKSGGRARAVETTAYAVLSLTMQDRLPEALKAIRWLAAQRNSRGGFVSTQDTMMALQAMATYSLKVSNADNDLTVVAKEVGAEHRFRLNEGNKLLLQREKLASLLAELEVEVSGTGCFMVQTVLRYNAKRSPDQKSFSLRASQVGNLITLCAAYTGSKASTDMVVIEAEMLSGFSAVPASLSQLNLVKKYEVDPENGVVALYLDAMPKEENCWTFEVKRTAEVGELKPAVVSVYDYYNEEDRFSTDYQLLG